MLFRKIKGDPQLRWYISKCKYCGTTYTKTQNRTMFCSNECRTKSKQDSKAKYQRKRRKLIRDREIISNERNYIGTGLLSKHANKDFKKEHHSILKECRRIGVNKNGRL